jgi:phospholipase D1/2
MDLILREGRNCWRKARTRRAAFLVDGEAYYAAFVQAASKAEHALFIAGWDIDSRIPLLRDKGESGPRLGDFLEGLISSRPELHVYILVWDFMRLYAMNQGHLPIFELHWRTHPRIHFHMDADHPTGSAHHQKIVVVDDKVAFAGGMDLTNGRWDTSAHLPDDPRRVDPSGVAYPACHDVQMLVDGDAARCLGDLVRSRWLRVDGSFLPHPLPDENDIWPQCAIPVLRDVDVAVARTLPGFKDHPEVREVEALYLDAIRAARETIYIENQYLTSSVVEEALMQRLRERHGPEVVAILSRASPGWLERGSVGALRAGLLKRLFAADRHHRLGIFYPVVPGAAEDFVAVHAKVLVVDDVLVRVGSSNMNNRSLMLDTECDLAIEAGDNPELQCGILHFRNTLLAEHLGTTPEAILEAAAEKKLLKAVEALRGEGRTLRPMPDEVTEIVKEALEESLLPKEVERPLHVEELIDQFIRYDDHPAGRRLFFQLAGLMLFLILLALAWRFLYFEEGVDMETISRWAWEIRANSWAPLIVTGAFVVGSLLMFPVTLLIGGVAVIFDPILGYFCALAGVLAGGSANYFVGRLLRHNFIRRLARGKLNRLSKALARRGVVSVALAHLLPVAPFSIINMVAGASHIRFRDFILGSILGKTPFLIAVTFFTDRVKTLLITPTATNLFILGTATVLLLIGTIWCIKRFSPKPGSKAKRP